LFQAPLGILKLSGNSLRRHVSIDRGIGSGFSKPGMGGDEMEIRIEFNDVVRGPKPEFFMGQWIGNRVIGFFKLHMAVAVDFDLTPGSHLHGNIRQRF